MISDLTGDSYVWLRCHNCGNGLWRAYSDRIEMPMTLRGHQKRVISVDIAGMSNIKVICEKCGVAWQK